MENKKPKTQPDAILYLETVVVKWKPEKDVWPFVYGNDALACLAILGGLFTTHIFRKELKIRPYARITCYTPVVGLSALGANLYHSFVTSTDLIQANACPLCIQTKASLVQVLFGIGFPTIIAPAVCFYIADRLLTYPVPPLLKAPGEVFHLFRKIVTKYPRSFMVFGAINFAASWFVTYEKQKSLQKINYGLRYKN